MTAGTSLETVPMYRSAGQVIGRSTETGASEPQRSTPVNDDLAT